MTAPHIRNAAFLLFFWFLLVADAHGQCSNWGITAQLVNASSCTGNGSIKVTLTGPDTVNLSNIQYGIPINVNGFSVPLNNSTTFTGVPRGTYTISAVALCGGTYVGKSTTFNMPGNYQSPTFSIPSTTPTAQCASRGSVSLGVNNGLPPYTFRLTNANGVLLGTRVVNTPFASFNNLAPGSYFGNVVDACGSGTAPWPFTISTDYPSLTSNPWPTFTCRNTGYYSGSIVGGLPPYALTLSLNGSIVARQTISNTGFRFNNLGAGNYALTFSDACGTVGGASNIFIDSLNPASMPLTFTGSVSAIGCDSFQLDHPYLASNNYYWSTYYMDTSFTLSMQISGGMLAPTPFVRLTKPEPLYRIPSGKSVKDFYGKVVTYTLKHPCGTDIIGTATIPFPSVYAAYDQHCNIDMTPAIAFSNNVCFPVSYTMSNTASGQTYGPFTAGASTGSAPNLPFGNYSISYTTADGYTGTGALLTVPGVGNPYSVTVNSEAKGMHNYVDYFEFYSNAVSARDVTVELFNGPTGYTFQTSTIAYSSSRPFLSVIQNQTPTTGSNLFFPPGNYVWKLTDDCGTYFVPMTVTTNDLYQFTVNAALVPTCQGLSVTPTGTARYAGVPTPIYFSVLKNGVNYGPNIIQGVPTWDRSPLGTTFLITEPGNYTIITTAEPNPNRGSPALGYFYPFNFPRQYPNPYTKSFSFTYQENSLKVDVNKSQGFSCPSEGFGQGKIYVQGQGGLPFQGSAPYYRYSLAAQGMGASGPYISQNFTGVFTNFAGSANNIYDVKIEDTCGASAVQSIKILDLGNTRLISSNHYSTCAFDTIQLVALYLPNATYSWTGPNGFTSTLRNPVIPRASLANIGVYRVTITTTLCNGALRDSTVLSLNASPPKPIVAIDCGSDPVSLMVTNPSSRIRYEWNVGYYSSYAGLRYSQQRSDTANIKYVYDQSNFVPIAIDSATGCKSFGDTTVFTGDPNYPLNVGIYSPHLKLCTGDSTTLVAQLDSALNINGGFQWYKNNVLMPGETAVTLRVGTPGSYRVRASVLPCRVDTSDAAVVTVVPPPTASITAPIIQVCEGDTAFITGNTGAGYAYTWHLNNSTIPGIFGAIMPAVKTGDYYATVSNGACVANSNKIHITVIPTPVVQLSPAADQFLCSNQTVTFSTPANPLYSYQWQKNGINIPNARSNNYTTGLVGGYRVIVSTPTCPNVTSTTANITLLPEGVRLRNDTVICNTDPFSIELSVAAGFDAYAWSNNQAGSTSTVTQPGTYWVRATNACGTFTDTVHIHTLKEYLPALPDDTVICNAGNLAILRVPPLLQQCVWSTGATGNTLSVTEPGTYWVAGSSPCGPISDTMRVGFCPPVINDILLSKDSICEGDCIRIRSTTSQYPQTFRWTFGGGSPDTADKEAPQIICYPKAGVYPISLTVKNAGGSDSYTTQIVVQQKPEPRFKDTTMVVSYKTSLVLPACATAQNVDWYREGILVCSHCNSINIEAKDYRTVYHCIVSNGDCVDSCLYKMQVIDIPHDVWLPDAFTPNGDGRNDAFHIITDNPNVHNVELTVYNRWGQKLYISHTTTDGWDGRINGAAADMGTYFWTLKYWVLGTEEIFSKKGDIILVR